ncbi:hypothetical protein BCR33DRAFT_563338 [Rhizoclosmatium globosum]|uniref:N-acetyltransferase domain-containing protein n=1 Tax=Rhizoclosmatium globosum TaxID=329046 RepID=A0A1Y2B8X6_9FUNG|nr:hypothetical protein BCR33DRAFT_563338 [Rhizoclosmatium globosum]|eukprot:ORY30947.1 hypothetical protein BCR33DRAFT_563338 [Rhizoclosmatium globosum]
MSLEHCRLSRYPASNEVIDQMLETITRHSTNSQSSHLSLIGHLTHHRLQNSFQPVPQHRHVITFSNSSNTSDISTSIGFAYVDTKEESDTATNTWFAPNTPPAFIRSSIHQLVKYCNALPDSPSNNVLFNYISHDYIPYIKDICTVSYEVLPHIGFIYRNTSANALDSLSHPIRARFTIQNESYVIDTIRHSDISTILTNNKYEGYPTREYVESCINCPIVGPLSRVIRVLPSIDAPVPKELGELQPVSWCFVHIGFSIGLMWTMPEYRQRGLGVVCVASVTKALFEYMEKESKNSGKVVAPHCWTQQENAGSIATFRKCGYGIVDGVAVDWIVGTLKEEFK